MKLTIVSVLFSVICYATAAAGAIQLQSTPGILIPAQALRFARSAYGGASSSSSSSHAAPASKASYSSAAAAPASYGSSTQIPAPPCPKNYMFGCQPSLTPVPCAAPAYSAPSSSYSATASSYSAPTISMAAPQGSHSHYYPQYAFPQYAVPIVREIY